MPLSKSPLRYPGGKQKLAPFVSEIITQNNLVGGHYAEPYAGGAGAALELLLTNQVGVIHLNDSSYPIYCFWHSVLTEPDLFCRRILSATMTVEEWGRHKSIVKEPDGKDMLDVGFSTFYLNRVNRSGVITGGLIGGNNQEGNYKMDARFTRNELIRRVESIAARALSIRIHNLDAEAYIRNYLPTLPENSLVYYDPPYFEKASGLYLNFYKKQDHARLASVIQSEFRCKWILSYDNAEEIIALYNSRRHFTYDLQYNASKVYKGKEVFVFSDSINLPERSSLKYINTSLQQMLEGLQLV